MEKPQYRSALIVGTGPGLSASLARLFARQGLAVAVAARQTDKLAGLAKETGASVHACNAADEAQVAGLFAELDAQRRTPDVVGYLSIARRKRCGGRWTSAPSAPSWCPSRRRGACCRTPTARSFSPAPPRA